MEKIAEITIESYKTTELPAGTTHVEYELDYSGCYYEGDIPTVTLICYKNTETN